MLVFAASTSPSTLSRPRARGPDQRLHEQRRDAAVAPSVGDHDAELAAQALRLAGQVVEEFALAGAVRGANRPDGYAAAVGKAELLP